MKIIPMLLLWATPFLLLSQDVYDEVDEMPKYAGCDDAVFPDCTLPKVVDYISAKLKYPVEAMEKGIEGTALVSFVVQADGRITSIDLTRDPGEGCGEAAKKVIEKMATEVTWIPGKLNGKEVAVRFNMPVQFKL